MRKIKKNHNIRFIGILLGLIIVYSCSHESNKKNEVQPVFKVSKAIESILIDGKMDEVIWRETEARNFSYYFDIVKDTDKQNTTFRMLWDKTNLYLFYECEDKFITARETVRDGAPYFDDCAEIFLIPVPESLKVHYGFEVNLYKTSNDFIYVNDFYDGEFAAFKGFNPKFEVEFTVNGTINDNSDIDKGWTMEMAIPISVFKGVDKFHPVEAGNKWKFLALRQDRNDAEGDRRTASTMFPTEKNVHDEQFFGILEFVD